MLEASSGHAGPRCSSRAYGRRGVLQWDIINTQILIRQMSCVFSLEMMRDLMAPPSPRLWRAAGGGRYYAGGTCTSISTCVWMKKTSICGSPRLWRGARVAGTLIPRSLCGRLLEWPAAKAAAPDCLCQSRALRPRFAGATEGL